MGEQLTANGPEKVEAGATAITGRSGTVYRRADSVSFARYGLMERLSIELAYQRDVQGLFQSQKRAYELLDKQKLADAAVEIHNGMMGVARVADGKANPAAALCMLFWNADNEDAGAITEAQLAAKVADVDHLDARFFFVQAVSSVPGLLAAFRDLFQGSSVDEGLLQGAFSPLKAEAPDQKR